jgi:hypothetical protein
VQELCSAGKTSQSDARKGPQEGEVCQVAARRRNKGTRLYSSSCASQPELLDALVRFLDEMPAKVAIHRPRGFFQIATGS